MSEREELFGDDESLEEATLLAPGLIHELRHPLVGIKGGLELVARRLAHIARAMMRNHGGNVRLVEDADPARLPWARTEFAVEIPAGPR